jgi:hypothetical protein
VFFFGLNVFIERSGFLGYLTLFTMAALSLAIKQPFTFQVSKRDYPEVYWRDKLFIARNLIVYSLRDRNPELWIDEPPPEKDPEIGIGRHVAWQTPLHREAVKKAIKRYRS